MNARAKDRSSGYTDVARAHAGRAGIRAMLTHPIDDEAAKFCTRFGFIASPLREQQLLLLLKGARRWATSAPWCTSSAGTKRSAKRPRT